MSQETYSLGEVVTVSSARLTNVGVTAAPIELKVWAQVPMALWYRW